MPEWDVEEVSEPATAATVANAPAAPPHVTEVLRLQRLVGNRVVSRMAATPAGRRLARRSAEERAMVDKDSGEKGTTDEPLIGPEGDRFVWDGFDRTLTIFTSPTGPHGGKAVQLVYADGTAEELAKRKPEELIQHAEELSPQRAATMEYLRTAQGHYQEAASAVAARVASAGTGRPTLCYLHTSGVANLLSKGAEKGMSGMDPRGGAIKGGRAGAFHTLESHPAGPKPGDVVSYGKVLPPESQKKTLRRANFFTILHIGIFKSRRTVGGQEVWTVVDGGQGKFEGRQEIRERTRTFTRERLEVAIPKTFKGAEVVAWDTPQVIECGVLKSKVADAGQSADDKLLRGWIDIDEYYGRGTPPTAGTAGVNNRVFVGNKRAAELDAAATGG